MESLIKVSDLVSNGLNYRANRMQSSLPWAMRLLGFQPALPINVLGIASLALGWSLLPFRASPCISL